MKVTIKAHIHASQDQVYENGKYHSFVAYKAWPCKLSSDSDNVYVCDAELEVDIPHEFDIRAGLVANLEEEKRKAAAEYQRRVTELNAQIQSLLAIEG